MTGASGPGRGLVDRVALNRAGQADAEPIRRKLHLPDECLNENLFRGLRHAREIIEIWRHDYNDDRPHTSLNRLTPIEFATRSKREEPRTN